MSVIKAYREHKYGTLYKKKKTSFLFFLLDVGYDNHHEME
jgi:hypothetical protein